MVGVHCGLLLQELGSSFYKARTAYLQTLPFSSIKLLQRKSLHFIGAKRFGESNFVIDTPLTFAKKLSSFYRYMVVLSRAWCTIFCDTKFYIYICIYIYIYVEHLLVLMFSKNVWFILRRHGLTRMGGQGDHQKNIKTNSKHFETHTGTYKMPCKACTDRI